MNCLLFPKTQRATRYFWLAVAVVSILLPACEKEIEFKGDGKEPLLVLNAILENNEIPMVTVSRSAFFLTNNTDPTIKELSGATVVLTNLDLNESYVLTNLPSSGKYIGSVPVQPNTRYKIEVSYPNFKSISSELTTVEDVVLTSIDTNSAILEFSPGVIQYATRVVFSFQDHSGEHFYALSSRPFVNRNYYDEDSVFLYTTSGYLQQSTFCNESTLQYSFNGNYFFNDVLYQNQLLNLSINTVRTAGYVYDYNTGMYYTDEIVKWLGTLKSMTKDTYLYFKTTMNNQGGTPFSDPTNVHSNIQNGLGIFGSVSTDQKEK